MAKLVNLLLIGLGPHARRIYYPISATFGKKNDFRVAAVIDLKEKELEIEEYFKNNKYSRPDMLYLSAEEKGRKQLSDKLVDNLNKLVDKHNIHGVIISTEPLAHVCYAKWAMHHGLHVLMDKPISTKENVANSLKKADELVKDYDELERFYRKAKKKDRNITFSLMAQRRFHPAFKKMKSLIAEVFDKTNCPVTSIQSFHSDGQWRMPTEIVEQDYHPYNQGYGKCSHSGYHSIDMVPWLLEAGQGGKKKPNNVDVFSSFVRPKDHLAQLNLDDYRKLFADFDKHNKYSERKLNIIYEGYGEIDSFTNLAFKKDSETMTLGSINLVHNGFAQRNWVTAKGRDLYKGNGRVRHESHYIEQGPFQAISFISYQSKEVDPKKVVGIYDVGGEYHLDIHVFRNDKMFPDWENYRKYSTQDLSLIKMQDMSRGHQEDARRQAVLEFVSLTRGEKVQPTSDLLDHKLSTLLMSAIYRSAILANKNRNPLVNISI